MIVIRPAARWMALVAASLGRTKPRGPDLERAAPCPCDKTQNVYACRISLQKDRRTYTPVNSGGTTVTLQTPSGDHIALAGNTKIWGAAA